MSDVIAGRYRVEDVLGRGGMSVVYRAVDSVTGRRVALKRMTAPTGTEAHRQRMAALFEHEFCTLSELSHPRVIEVYDYGTAGDGAYYTMELLDGSDLREVAPLPWRDACSILRDVCSALALLHSRRLLHRDLTP